MLQTHFGEDLDAVWNLSIVYPHLLKESTTLKDHAFQFRELRDKCAQNLVSQPDLVQPQDLQETKAVKQKLLEMRRGTEIRPQRVRPGCFIPKITRSPS